MSRSSASAAPLIRPAWTPATIVLMVLGFVIWWPLGLAALAYIVWGERLGWSDPLGDAGDFCRRRARASGFSKPSGNLAFDEWRDEQLSRLEQERRRLDEMRREFDDHLRELRRARDRREFDGFMAAYASKRSSRAGTSTRTEGDYPGSVVIDAD